jgi:hypothetical protein
MEVGNKTNAILIVHVTFMRMHLAKEKLREGVQA